MGDVALHLRGGTIVPMQQQSALVARDVRLAPITLVVALPAPASTQDKTSTPAYGLEEHCAGMRAFHPGKQVSCGYVFMDSGEDVSISPDTSVQVRESAACTQIMGFEGPYKQADMHLFERGWLLQDLPTWLASTNARKRAASSITAA